MKMTKDLFYDRELRKHLSLLAFICFLSLIVYDMVSEIDFIKNPNELIKYEIIEIVILSLGTLSFWLLWKSTEREERNKKKFEASKISFENEIKQIATERDRWKNTSNKFVQEFQDYISSHFDNWHLTEAEKEIGLFLVKGLSFKEIGTLRGVSEKTIRNQAITIYAKSGLKGRQELAAFFLEELLKPHDYQK